MAGVSIREGFKQQKINRINDSVQYFYYRLKNNLVFLNDFFDKSSVHECILTYFCSNESYASNFSIAYRTRFENLRINIINLLLNNDFTIFQRHLNQCKIKYNVSILNSNIQKLLEELLLLNGSVPVCNDDNEYFTQRPIYFCGNENSLAEDVALKKSKELKNLIYDINEEIDKLSLLI